MRQILLILILFLQVAVVAAQEPDYLALRAKMVEEQIQGRGITDKRLLDAFLGVERHMFVKPQFRKDAYKDSPLDIGKGQTVSEPYVVAVLTHAVAPGNDKKILEIGTGSGYHAAILAELAETVYTIEVYEKLGAEAKTRLDSLGYKNIKFKIGDGFKGWKKYAPYDGIIVTCSEDHIPQTLIDQLAVGGRLIIPVTYSSKVQELILLEKDHKGNLKRKYLIPVQFIPLIRGKDEG
ncbi:MAG: protein-L-isoaspartate(D-aspartate) O-methyltransferase [bacterium]|nr:protein-L-isoaspartate(D-aspartate) O-methyltransferase [bacterium]